MNPNQHSLETARTELHKALKATKRSFIFVGLFSFVINILMLTPALYMLQVYDRVMQSRSIETLILITLIVVALFVVMGLLEIIRARVLVRVGNRLDMQLNGHLFDSIFYIAKLNPASATAQPISDLTKVRQFLTGNGVFAFFDAPWFPIYLFILYLFSPWLALFAFLASLIIMAITLVNDFTTKKKLAEANELHGKAQNFISRNLQNAEVVHAMGMHVHLKDHWLKRHLKFLATQSEASDIAGKWSNTSKTLRQMFQALTYGIGAYLAIMGDISDGMIIAGAVLMGRALQPLDLLTNSWKQFVDSKMAYQRLNRLLAQVPEIPETMSLPAPKGEIRLEAVTVVPPGAKTPTIKGINMLIPAGSTVGLIGPSASGKSTLARAILGVWPLANGKVRLDGADIHQWDNVELGQYIGYLPQDIELFEGTISQNISRFGELDSDEIVKAAQLAGVHEMILRLPNGYDTHVGPGGATLSGGQRQRVGLARALYKRPKLIVLDEPNSNLDDIGEKALLNAILQMKQLKSTIILITHKTNILTAVDNIAVLQDGVLSLYDEKNKVLQALQQKAQAASQQPDPKQQGGQGASVKMGKPTMRNPGESK